MSVSFVMKLNLTWRSRLLLSTVPMASMAPSAVDMEAATIPMRHQPPRKEGILCVSTLMKASASGTHMAHVGSKRISEHVSGSNTAKEESGPYKTRVIAPK
mmetsp:Transcript_24818/g.37085  ORF Transcript_24818/g.37085 Transcript_24818/m.37085 type:complete len:101 (+) Transcript_24818:746-1048(+)